MIKTADQAVAYFLQKWDEYKSEPVVLSDEDCISLVLASVPEHFEPVMKAVGLNEHPTVLEILASRKPKAAHKPAWFYLVSSVEEGEHVWKWGITTKPTAKKRNSAYYDTHRWIEISSMAVGRRMEKLMGCLMVNVLNERQKRSMYTESVPQSFPFEVLVEMIDWVINSVDERGQWPAIGDELYTAACPGIVGLKDAAPKFALEWRLKMNEALRPVKKKELEPMWA